VADSGLSSLAMTSLSLLLAVVAEEARGVGGGVGGAATLTL